MASQTALAEAYRQAEARGAARAQAALRVAYERYAGRSPAAFLDAAIRILGVGHAQSAAKARAYYIESRLAEGLPAVLPAIEPVVFDAEAAVVSLRVTGEQTVATQVASGVAAQAASLAGQAAVLRFGKRAVLTGGRETITRSALADEDALGYARVSDGSPCAFCAMLVSRGTVYTAESVKFRAHDGCGCTARPMYRGDKDGGWTPQARQLRAVWDDVNAGKILDDKGRPRSFRSVVEEQQRKGGQPLASVTPISPRSRAAAQRAMTQRLTRADLTRAETARVAQAARDNALGKISKSTFSSISAEVEAGVRERLLRAAA